MDRSRTRDVSFDTYIPGADFTYGENLEDESAQIPFAIMENRKAMEEILRKAELSEYEQAILSLRYGIHMKHLRGKMVGSRRAKVSYDKAFAIAGTAGLTNNEVERIFDLKATSLRHSKRKALRKIRAVIENS